MTTTSSSATADYPGSWELAAAAATLASGLPPELAPLARLAYNYRWSWEPGGEDVFRDLDPLGWERSGQNPVRLLADLPLDRAEAAAADAGLRERVDGVVAAIDAELVRPLRPIEGVHGPVAFFCAEFGVHASLPIYSGGLGVLAGDILKEASDLGYPLVGVGLLYRRGYFHQRVDRTGMQQEYWLQLFPEWTPAVQLTQEGGGPLELEFELFGRSVAFHVWRVDVGRVPLYLLDTDLPRNDAIERWITSRLYEGNSAIRLAPVRPARDRRHAGAARARDRAGRAALQRGPPRARGARAGAADVAAGVPLEEALERDARVVRVHDAHARAGRQRDVPAGGVPRRVPRLAGRLGIDAAATCSTCAGPIRTRRVEPGMTPLALRMSRRANAVSRRHGEVAREMWRPLYGATAPERRRSRT